MSLMQPVAMWRGTKLVPPSVQMNVVRIVGRGTVAPSALTPEPRRQAVNPVYVHSNPPAVRVHGMKAVCNCAICAAAAACPMDVE